MVKFRTSGTFPPVLVWAADKVATNNIDRATKSFFIESPRIASWERFPRGAQYTRGRGFVYREVHSPPRGGCFKTELNSAEKLKFSRENVRVFSEPGNFRAHLGIDPV